MKEPTLARSFDLDVAFTCVGAFFGMAAFGASIEVWRLDRRDPQQHIIAMTYEVKAEHIVRNGQQALPQTNRGVCCPSIWPRRAYPLAALSRLAWHT